MNHAHAFGIRVTLASALGASGCGTDPQISYRDDVYPILAEKCIDCHTPPDGEGYRKIGLDMTSYEALMEGSIYGPVVKPGNSQMSPLNMLIEGRAGNLARLLEKRHKPITEREISVLRVWVEQGARNK
ncbi:MAG: hypothetical protein PVI28_17655 [Gammaproteobacteria bacterium]|jgi:hypothetical protein